MNPALVLFGIRSLVRLGRTTKEALEQHVRDDAVLFPQIQQLGGSPLVVVAGYFSREDNQGYVVGNEAPYADYWQVDGGFGSPRRDASSIDALLTAMAKIEQERGNALLPTTAPIAATLVKQWSDTAGPVSPWARVIVTAADIALEYVAVNPAILGGNGNGEQLLAAYAGNLSELLPDDGEFGTRHRFAERLAGLFLRAGLQTLSDHPDWAVSEDHVEELLTTSIKPLLDDAVFPTDLTTQLRWEKISDTLMGPVATAAFTTIAAHQSAFLGEGLAPDKAMGAVTRALFLQLSTARLDEAFTRPGLIGLYTAVLQVAANRPELFLGDGGGADESAAEGFARDLFTRVAGTLAAAPPPFDKSLGAALAATIIESLGTNAHRFSDGGTGWEQAATDMLSFLAEELSGALRASPRLRGALDGDDLVELGRILVEHIASSPGMVTGDDTAWQGVIRSVAQAMSADDRLLLDGDDWKRIVTAAAEDAATNPARLFHMQGSAENDVLAGDLLGLALTAAGELSGDGTLAARRVLFGETLADAMILLIRHTAGSPARAEANKERIAELIRALHRFVAENGMRYGSAEWFDLFETLLVDILDGGELPDLSTELVDKLLAGEMQ